MSEGHPRVAEVKLTRHARNRVRRIARAHPEVTVGRVLEALFAAETLGYDRWGNRHAGVLVGGTRLTVVIDERERVIVTIWEG